MVPPGRIEGQLEQQLEEDKTEMVAVLLQRLPSVVVRVKEVFGGKHKKLLFA
jgi:hypothetical protein